MSEMVERVAHAIAAAEAKFITARNDMRLAEIARAAIEAMREPTEAMQKVFVPAKDNGPAQTWGHRIKERVWRAMIEAALTS